MHPLEALSEIVLARPIEVQGASMPAGARGVVMATWGDGLAYEVEFTTPQHAVLTVQAGDILRMEFFIPDEDSAIAAGTLCARKELSHLRSERDQAIVGAAARAAVLAVLAVIKYHEAISEKQDA